MSDTGNARKLFGTDGIRGIANRDLTPQLALRTGQAVVEALRKAAGRPFIIVGRDTRLSGDMLGSAIIAGILSAGGRATDVGIAPTPAVAFLTQAMGAQAGIAISASHNTMEYNGIKIFSGDGFKLDDAVEASMEEMILAPERNDWPEGDGIGHIETRPDAAELYLDHLRVLGTRDLAGMRVVLDCANGAASGLAPALFEALGARVKAFYNTPDGVNINQRCGSICPEALRDLVRREGADAGLAFDGDADRLIMADATGEIVDGDQLLAIAAIDLKRRGMLARDTVVTTVMTNLGFEKAMRDAGIDVLKTAVGDRYVLEEMRRRGLNLGGEQSGHLIFLDHSTTGDGLLTGAMILEIMTERETPLAELASVMRRLPQVLLNVEVAQPERLGEDGPIWQEVRCCERELDGKGRVLVRPSGTEPYVRVMVEHQTLDEAVGLAERLALTIRREMGNGTS
ncbi:MAG: phosphoglucosamine mutase [Candidatus Geothermincolia bacterium]